jgi:hypothetical protein
MWGRRLFGADGTNTEEPSVAQMQTGLAGILAARRTPAIVPMEVP